MSRAKKILESSVDGISKALLSQNPMVTWREGSDVYVGKVCGFRTYVPYPGSASSSFDKELYTVRVGYRTKNGETFHHTFRSTDVNSEVLTLAANQEDNYRI